MPISRQTGAKRRRWERRKESRPEEIVAAALELFVERGFSATRLDEVARRAGVSKGTLYLYFENKEALFRAVLLNVALPILEQAEKRVADHEGSARELVQQLVLDWWGMIGETRISGIPKLMVAEASNFPELARFFVDNVVRRGRRIFTRVIERGIAAGEFRPCNARYAARVLMAPMVFAAIWQHSLSPFDADSYDVSDYLDLHLDVFVRGLSVARSD